MVLNSSVSCSLLVDNSDSFLCGFDVCHKFYPTFLNLSIPAASGQDKFATYILYDYRWNCKDFFAAASAAARDVASVAQLVAGGGAGGAGELQFEVFCL